MADKTADTVIWDIGRVLYQWDPRFLYEKRIADPARLDWFLNNVVTLDWHFQHDAGRPLAEMVPELVAQFPDERDLIEAYAPHWLETIPGPIAGTHDLVRRLAARNVPQFSITNFGTEFWAMFRPTAPILDYMGDIVVSGAEKMLKPDAAIFRLAANRFGVEPGQSLFIDDNEANIASARDLGFHVHHFTDAGLLEADLVERGLL